MKRKIALITVISVFHFSAVSVGICSNCMVALQRSEMCNCVVKPGLDGIHLKHELTSLTRAAFIAVQLKLAQSNEVRGL